MGMLFDHGCDAITSVLSAFMACKLFSTGNGIVALMAFILPTISFWYITLQEFYLGYMHLPALTGPDDTQLVFTILCFMVGYTGTEYWANNYWDIPYLGIGKVPVTQLIVGFLLLFEIP